MAKIDLSVHQVVDFVLRKGDIDNRVFNRSSMNEGTLLHALYQSKQGDNYLSEYFLETNLVIDDIEVHLEGRADGIIAKNNNKYVIDEIKTTVINLEEFYKQNEAWHLGQANFYAYMFMKERKLDEIEVRLTYISQKKHHEKLVKNFFYSYLEIEQFVYDILNEYLAFYHIVLMNQEKRHNSIEKLSFPYQNYRQGQKDLSKYVYSIATLGGRLFVEAPTGIGKTISTLFPSIKSLNKDEESKIFYLTAKSSGKENAYNVMKLLENNGGYISSIVITSKEKICFCKDKACNPDECPYTKGYYSKITSIIKYAIINHLNFNYQNIVDLAYQYEVCPFELELDLSLYLDVIICDYNYMFDPVSYMKRYFDEDASHHIALIDEAHNLIDRSLDMYSSVINEEEAVLARRSIRRTSLNSIKTILTKIIKFFLSLKDDFKAENNELIDINENTIKLFNRFIELMQVANKEDNKEISKDLLNFYLNVNRFMKIYELANESYIYNIKKGDKYYSLEMICLDASYYLRSIISRLKGAVFFSATLSPIDYYINTLGGKENDPVLKLESPFPKENFKLLVAPKISVKYKNREKSYPVVANYISSFIKNKKGNYFVFLPSYEYLSHLLEHLNFSDDVNYFVQEKEMNDIDKDNFLSQFIHSPEKTTIGFVILGGSFSEGIDLESDRIIGAVVVGIGMPKINFISDQRVIYYNSHKLNGKNYAYIYPGMNKVMQAVGRVIRDEKDVGAVLLIDERFATNQYQDLFKKEWSNYEIVLNEDEVEEEIRTFYKL